MANDNKNENKSNSTSTVTVACKHPHGLLLQLHDFQEVPEPINGGVRMVKMARPVGEPVRIHGPAAPFGQAPKTDVVGGYALTYGISKDFWEKWCEQNKGCAILKNELMFAYEKDGDTRAKAKENKAVKTGMEPIDPANPPKLGKQKIETDKEAMEAASA